MTAVAIGEVMVELNREPDGRYGLAFGGDTFNTAVYLARSGVSTAYASALGDDRFSEAILAVCDREGVETATVLRAAGRVPGLYLIDTDAKGERSFTYWRDVSPARDLFELPGWEQAAEQIVSARLVYLSAITLSLYSNVGLGRLFAVLEAARERGAIIAFDTNYRPRGWKGNVERARFVVGEALARTDVALPTFDDEQALWEDPDAIRTVERIVAAGVREIIVKNGAEGALVAGPSGVHHVPVPTTVDAVDTTAAGDSFNAGYLSARLRGEKPEAAAEAGHRLAAVVVAHRGAIVPRAATDVVTDRNT
jgi:2-dehydro-3-deoxygluconokinase